MFPFVQTSVAKATSIAARLVASAVLLGAQFALPVQAATPASGTVTESSRMLSFTGGPLLVSNPEGICASPQLCDNFALTVTVPDNFKQTNPNDSLQITMTFTPGTDMALRLLDGEGNVLSASDNGVGQPETVTAQIPAGTSTFTIQAYVFAGAVTSYTTSVQLTSAPPPPPPSVAQPFVVFDTPPELGNGAGEPSFGYNLLTQRGMYQSGLAVLKVTFPEQRNDDPLNPDGLPEVCDALWEDKSGGLATTTTTLDPIGFVDQITGRTFSGQLGPKAHLMEYSDDDGESWNPSVGNTPGAAGVDHQTIGYSPYVSPLPPGIVRNPATNYPNAVYYCSQDIAYANCSRSDDGGITFGPTVNMYTTLECGGLHGHVKGAPDGTVYVPNKGCGAGQGVAVSENNGLSWSVRTIPGTTPGSNDPAVGVATDGTVYFCYAGADGLPRAAVSKDKGRTWINDVSTGGDLNITKAVFPGAVAGDGDRAACSFVGTTTPGNTEALDFAGIWHTYVSVTYDGGKTWNATRVNPNDPVQAVGGLCTSGTTCGANRNLLDFNDMSIDEQGRLFFAYADGCIGGCVSNPLVVARTDKAALIRLSGAKSLYAEFDRPTPSRAEGSCLAGKRDDSESTLSWRAPVDVGGAAISKYRIYRGTSASNLTFIGETADAKPQYVDGLADAMVEKYFYRVTAVNSAGEGVNSNLIELPIALPGVGENICVAPGLTLLTDKANDIFDGITPNQSGSPQFDVRSLQVSQPLFEDGAYKLVFTLKMQSLAQIPPGNLWPIRFCSPGVTPCADPNAAFSATNKYFTVQMSTANSATPVFQILKPSNEAATRTTVVAEPMSNAKPDGTITIVVKASDIGLTPEASGMDKLDRFLVRIVAGAVTPDNMPDSLAASGELQTVTQTQCLPNAAPQAVLAADKTEAVDRATVNFTAAGSFDPDSIDRVVEYRFNFGDGTQPVRQAGATIAHTYTSPGNYGATVTVRDSRGVVSTRSAPVVIAVKSGTTVPAPAPGNPVIGGSPVATATSEAGRFGGGALGLGLLFALMPLALLRRRRV